MRREAPIKALRVLRAMAYYRLRGVKYDSLPYIRGKLPRVDCSGEVHVGRRFIVECLQMKVNFGAGPKGRLEIGDEVAINRGSTIFAMQSVTIGDGTRLGDLVSINDTNYHAVEEGTAVVTKPITIGANVWFGRGAMVMPGVDIGDHAVIGAGSVVTHDVPPRCFVAGVPATLVRELTASDGWRR